MGAEWLWLSATELGKGIESGDINPVDLTEVYLSAIANHDEAGKIYARVTADRARAEAESAAIRARNNQRVSILDGVPISWKDLFDTAGTKTEAGSALLEGRCPSADAVVLKNATRAGLVCLGKTHMSELAFSGLGLNPVTQTSPCINDAGAVAGGSSSGAAASVAFGLAAGAIGSDTGGSVRIPAAWNDLVGLKTTPGRLSLDGVVPLCSKFDTVGPLCRTVNDAGLLMAAVEGSRAPDLSNASLAKRRLLVLENVAFDAIEGAPLAGFNSAVERLQAAGANIERAEVKGVERALELSAILYTVEAYATWRDKIEEAPEKMFSEILVRFRAGALFSGSDYVAAWQELRAIRADWAQAVQAFDAVLVPSSPIMPPKLMQLLEDNEYYVNKNLLALRNTRIGNLMGTCALTLPTGLPSTGFQLLGTPMGEAKLLRIGHAAELALA